ncbi:1454_t:CDS:2, partial [Scutellospora calospora]
SFRETFSAIFPAIESYKSIRINLVMPISLVQHTSPVIVTSSCIRSTVWENWENKEIFSETNSHEKCITMRNIMG